MTFTPLTLVEELKKSPNFDVCYQRRLSSDDAKWGRNITEVDFPRPLITKLQEKGIYRLFEFQDQALQSIRAGKDTVIVAPTANGKTEAFMLPIISRLSSEEKKVQALLIYPTNALINDQFQKIRPLIESVGLGLACFTGDTPPEDRQKIFGTPPSVLLTNIDTIHANLSKSHYKAQFKELLRSVRFIVLDEIHTYVGTFGSHAHMILKRLKRLLETTPVIIGASATVSNAPKFVKDFFGHENIITCQKPRKYSLDLAIVYSKIKFKDAVTNIVKKLEREKIKTLVFTNDHKTSEVTIRALQRAGIQAKLHRGGMEPKDRKLIEDKFRCGSLKVLVATPTMELGVDIGSLDAIISPAINFTRTIQRIGRAGREGQESIAIVLLVIGNAISEFYHRFPEKYLEDRQSLYFEPRNFLIQKDQLLAAAADEPLGEQEIEGSHYLLEEMLRDGFLKQDSTSHRFVLTDKGKARLFQYNIRGGSEAADIRNIETEKEIGAGRQFPMATRELHSGAIYSLEGYTYESISFDMEKRIAWVKPVHTENSTTAHYNVEAQLLKTEETKTSANLVLEYGPVSVTETVIGYYVWDSDGKFVEKKQIDPIKYTFETNGLSFRFDLPLPEKTENREALFHTLAHLAILSGAQITGGELRELGYFFDETGQLILYESTPGGNGLTRLLLSRLEDFLCRLLLILEECEHGTSHCPCVYLYYCGKGNNNLDRKIARNFLEESLGPLVEDIDKHEEGASIPSKEETYQPKSEDYQDAPLASGMFVAEDGHRVRSRGELLIDNWLYRHGILHAYEKVIYDSKDVKMRCDFYLPEDDVYIEYWGLEKEEYQKRRQEKEKLYQKLSLRFFAVENNDIYDLDAHLGRMLAQCLRARRHTKDASHETLLREERVQKIMNIVEEIVDGTKIGPDWVRRAGDSFFRSMKKYAEINDLDSMFSYFTRLAKGKKGKSVAEWLRSKNLPTVESKYEEVEQICRE